MSVTYRLAWCSILCIFGFGCFSICVSANPLPVYPHPQPSFSGPVSGNVVSYPWILFAFIVDFFADLLIIYGGVLLLERFRLISNHRFFDIPRRILLVAVGIISLIGFTSEWIIGGWIWGFLLILILIFISFVFVSKYLFLFNMKNSIGMGCFATTVNLVVWIFIFVVF